MALSIDEVLERIGGYGLYQKRLTVIMTIMEAINMCYQILIMVFIAAEPSWHCVNNATNCTLEGDIKPTMKTYNYRCHIDRDQWEFSKDFTSIVTEVGSGYNSLNLQFLMI